MKITHVKSLSIPEIKVIQFERFSDHRGYFTETFRKSDYQNNPDMVFLKNVNFVQCNESFSRKGVIRGLHFQWNPYMGKLVRTINGHMVDIVLDIRTQSPTWGKIIAYDMPCHSIDKFGEWIWVPPGFAHGNLFLEDTVIEYFCSGEYSQGYETGISPLANDIDWALCDSKLRDIFLSVSSDSALMTEKDRNGYSLNEWLKNKDSENFIFKKI
jgi:dTDP-4-dehydrorhamnose 3,5-epimerase